MIAVSETWIQDNIYSTELFDGRYTVFRCDRRLTDMEVSRGGGVLLGVKNDFKATPIDLREMNVNVAKVDIVECKVYFNFTSVYIFVVYIPPNVTWMELLNFTGNFE